MPGKRISKIEYVGKREVYDLQVENTPNFVLEGGLVSHNSGKSYACLSICESIDKKFNIDRVVFNGVELMNLINSGKLKKGSAIMFDEMSIDMDNRNWNSTTNKMINYLMQTFRYRGFIMLMNSPFMDFVDSKTRKLFHAEISMKEIDYKKKKAIMLPRIIQYNSRRQKFYYKRLRVFHPKLGLMPVDTWSMNKPSAKLVKMYEEKKHKYAMMLNDRILKELLDVSNPNHKKRKRDDIDLSLFKADMEAGMSVSRLCAKYDVSFLKCGVIRAKVKTEYPDIKMPNRRGANQYSNPVA